jgi:hypothetical protein
MSHVAQAHRVSRAAAVDPSAARGVIFGPHTLKPLLLSSGNGCSHPFQKGLAVIRLTTSILLLTTVATGRGSVWAAEPKVAGAAETRYLTFQLMTGLPGYAGPPPIPGHFSLSKAQI